MSCKKYVNEDECRYYPTNCYNCECSYAYTREDEEIEDITEEDSEIKETIKAR